jgi:[ribosomal protein S18]-alanine N-acetyltransferase
LIIGSDFSANSVAEIMPIMEAAFDPEYGEAWSASQCLSLLAMPNSQLLVAREKEVVVGFALSRWVCDEEELLMIGVDPEKQQRGIGANLLNLVCKNAAEGKRNIIFLEVRDSNQAKDFYLKANFQPVGQRPGYYLGMHGQRFDAITMRKQI